MKKKVIVLSAMALISVIANANELHHTMVENPSNPPAPLNHLRISPMAGIPVNVNVGNGGHENNYPHGRNGDNGFITGGNGQNGADVRHGHGGNGGHGGWGPVHGGNGGNGGNSYNTGAN